MKYYSLEDVIFFLEYSDMPLTERRILAKKHQVNHVMEMDKDELESYLKGKIDTSDKIDISKQRSGVMEVEENLEPIMSEAVMENHRVRFSRWLTSKRRSPFLLAHMPAEEVDESQIDPKRKYYRIDVDYWKADQRKVKAIKKSAIAAQTIETVLHKQGNDGKSQSFKFAADLFEDRVLSVGKDSKKSKDRQVRLSGSSSSAWGTSKVSVRGPPIIVVPNSLTGCISSYNAGDFLSEEAKWISIADKKKSGGKREREIKIVHEFPNGSSVEFLVIDDPRTLRSEQDWERIVAVFSLGEPWQFKEWKYSDPVELFQNVCGVHLMLDNDKVSQNIKSWSCKVLKINQFKRHLDVGAANDFWDMLHAFCSKKKTWMYKPSSSIGR